MKYTHYLPHTGERGTLINIPYAALRDKAQFEKVVGRLVAEFEHTDSMLEETTDVKLMDGTRFYFNDSFEPSSIFVKEDGTMVEGYHGMPVCAEDPDKTTRVSIKVTEGFDALTPFAASHHSEDIINDIASGLGATFYDERGQLTVIPHHNIQKATVIEAPYGG